MVRQGTEGVGGLSLASPDPPRAAVTRPLSCVAPAVACLNWVVSCVCQGEVAKNRATQRARQSYMDYEAAEALLALHFVFCA